MQPKTSRRARLLRSRPFRFGLAMGVGLLLVGCGKHYWNKPGAADSDFNRDSMECARENSVQMTSTKDYGRVIADLYKMCWKARGIEEDGLMKFAPPPAQEPAPQPRS